MSPTHLAKEKNFSIAAKSCKRKLTKKSQVQVFHIHNELTAESSRVTEVLYLFPQSAFSSFVELEAILIA